MKSDIFMRAQVFQKLVLYASPDKEIVGGLMNRETVLRIAIALALSLLMLTPLVAVGDSSSSNPFHSEYDSISIRVVTNRRSYLVEEVVRIRVYMVNDGNEAVQFPIFSAGYEVFDSEGRGLIGLFCDYLYAGDCLPVFPPQTETLFEAFCWNQKTADGKDIGVGTYRIRILVNSLVNCPIGRFAEIVIRVFPDIDARPPQARSSRGFVFY